MPVKQYQQPPGLGRSPAGCIVKIVFTLDSKDGDEPYLRPAAIVESELDHESAEGESQDS
jgi:hypothetical protein